MIHPEIRYAHPHDFVIPSDYDGSDIEVLTRDKHLFESIKEHGVGNPLFAEGQRIVNGVRRLRLALKLGIEKVPYIDVTGWTFKEKGDPRPSLFRVVNRHYETIKMMVAADRAACDESTTGVPGTSSVKAQATIEVWKAFEQAVGWSKSYITTGFTLFNELNARATDPEDEESKRIRSTFRNYGLLAALRMIDRIDPALDDSEPDPSNARMDNCDAPYIIKSRTSVPKHTNEQSYNNAVATLRRELGEDLSTAARQALEYLES